MKDLNALVELAKKAEHSEIYSMSPGQLSDLTGIDESVGSLIEACRPENILAIAEAILALEQRAEAAESLSAEAAIKCVGYAEANRVSLERAEAAEAQVEAEIANHRKHAASLINQRGELRKRAEVAEAKLAELEKQEPVAWIFEDELPENYPYDAMFPYSKVEVVRMFPVFGPAPAINLAELVKKVMPAYADNNIEEFYGCSDDFCVGWNHHAAAILRRIEEAK